MNRGGFGPADAKIVCVGEAYGGEEERAGRPFIGAAGQELRRWIRFAGLDPDSVYYTNVINKRPWKNDFGQFCLKKKEAEAEYPKWKSVLEMQTGKEWPEKYTWKAIASGKYLHPKYLHEVYNLIEEIKAVGPNIVIPLGNIACWALLSETGIMKLRGAVGWSMALGCKCLPMIHPAAILRVHENKPLCLADMAKAVAEAETSNISRPHRELWLDPDTVDLDIFEQKLLSAKEIGCDIETEPSAGIIKMVGFSADENAAICIPFFDPRKESGNYWDSYYSEALAWKYVSRWLAFPQTKIFQNGYYDITWLWAEVGLYPNDWDDTLLQAHSLQPELPKDLGTLGSIYTREPAWKLMGRKSAKEEA